MLNNAVSRAFELPHFKEIISKSKTIQNTINHSYILTADLKKIQSRLQLATKKIPSASPTRWWSLYHLAKSIRQNYQPINILFNESSKTKSKYRNLNIDGNDLDLLDILIDSLTKYEEFCNHMSGETYVTASVIIPLLRQLNSKQATNMHSESAETPDAFNDNTDDDDDATYCSEAETKRNVSLEVESTILNYINAKYADDDTNVFLKNCCYLDPRFKTDYFSDEDTCIVKKNLEKTLKLFNVQDLCEEAPSPKEKLTGIAAVLAGPSRSVKISGSIAPVSLADKIKLEYNRYEATGTIEFSANPLKWWKIHQTMFPILAKMSQFFLTAQGTSTASERVFSCGGNVITDTRASLTSEHAEQLIFLAMNKKYIPK